MHGHRDCDAQTDRLFESQPMMSRLGASTSSDRERIGRISFLPENRYR